MDLIKQKNEGEQKIIKISLSLAALGIAGIILLGMAGGFVASSLWQPTVPLNEENGQLVTTIKEVKVTPNTAVVDAVKGTQESVLLISQQRESSPVFYATATVITNDGLIVTAGDVPTLNVFAYDSRGGSIKADFLGRDEVFGLAYFRLTKGVFSPLDISNQGVPIGYNLMAVSKNEITQLPFAANYRVNEYILPPKIMPDGVQRIMKGNAIGDRLRQGSPLIDEEGKMSGIIVNPQAGLALPPNAVKNSLQRVVEGKREYNPYKELGFAVRHDFINLDKENENIYGAMVQSVSIRSKASQAGLESGDVIVAVEGERLSWDKNILTAISKEPPIKLDILRDADKLTITIDD